MMGEMWKCVLKIYDRTISYTVGDGAGSYHPVTSILINNRWQMRDTLINKYEDK